jgi:tetratricopeptide (TPR) repeat protein
LLAVMLAPHLAAAADAVGSATSDAEGVKEARARRLAEAGLQQYRAGAYDEAIASFEAAFALAPAPGLLYNLAQAHRMKGDCPGAFALYRRYLDSDPGGKLRARTLARLAELQGCADGRGGPQEKAVNAVPSGNDPVGLRAGAPAVVPPTLPTPAPAVTVGLGERPIAPRPLRHTFAKIGLGAGSVALLSLGGYFGWQSSRAAGDVSKVFDQHGRWDETAAARERAGVRDQKLAVGAVIGAVLVAAVDIWLLARD